jgi:hypothetical protein
VTIRSRRMVIGMGMKPIRRLTWSEKSEKRSLACDRSTSKASVMVKSDVSVFIYILF